MSTTPRLLMTLLEAAQDQPEVPLNEALRILDTLVQLAVIDKDLATAPVSPSPGDTYIVAGPIPAGAWASFAVGDVAYYLGGWHAIAPLTGYRAYVQDEDATYVYKLGSPAVWLSTGDYNDAQALAAIGAALIDTDTVTWTGFQANVIKQLMITTVAGTTDSLALVDRATRKRYTNAAGCAVTVPTHASVAFSAGDVVQLKAAGVVAPTISAAGGVTVNVPDGYTPALRAIGSVAQLVNVAGADEWDLEGDLLTV